MLNKDMLKRCFENAKRSGCKYVAVVVKKKEFKKKEIFITQSDDFDIKLSFYNEYFDDNLVLIGNDDIRIFAFTYANTFTEIEKDLFGEE